MCTKVCKTMTFLPSLLVSFVYQHKPVLMVGAVSLRLQQILAAAWRQDLEPEAFSAFPVVSVGPVKDITQTCLLF